MPPGTYRNITGNQALGARPGRGERQSRAAAVPRRLPDHAGLRHPRRARRGTSASASAPSRPRTRSPASAPRSAPPSAARSASRTSSGPGIALKAETIGLAVTLELPLVVVDIQRAGPSTGLPTKTEQADLLQAMFGRNGESPVPVVAASTPGDCFDAALEAARIALTYRTPVILLSDGYLANGSEPWLLPGRGDAARRSRSSSPPSRTATASSCPTCATPRRWPAPWAIPGTPGLEHRIGGLEKADGTGNISYDPDNHDHMVRLRAQKVAASRPTSRRSRSTTRTARTLLVLGWGSTYGPIARRRAPRPRKRRQQVAQAHLRHLNPFPRNLGEVLRALRPGARPGDEPRPAAEAGARRVPRRRGRLQPGARAAVHARPSSPSAMEATAVTEQRQRRR